MSRRQPENKLLGEWFWTDRWSGSSGFLLPMEPRGLYREMLTQAWLRGARTRTYPRLPSDEEAIRRACGCTEKEWSKCWPKVQPYWRVEDASWLVNDTQLEVYAKCLAEFEAASNRGKKGAQARAQARAQADTQAPTQVTTQVDTRGARERVLEDNPPDPDPDESSINQNSRRGRARAFVGQRLRVSEAMHQLLVAELGADVGRMDWHTRYAVWDARLVESGEPFDALPFIKAQAREEVAARRRAGGASPREESGDWFEECQRLHGGACGGRLKHHGRMGIDAEKIKAVTA